MNPVEDRRQSPRKANTGPQMIDATRHIVHSASSMHMDALEDKSIELVVTSPPYPMIQMWDEQFAGFDQAIEKDLDRENGSEAFERMHKVLDSVWEECFRVLVPGGIIAINVGDATRKLGAHFRLYHNQSRIISTLRELGFHILPQIIWRKPTNAPNKFMGSGMLPGGAYVTLEHEHIILARKGGNRRFSTEADKERRRQSAYFWEERNLWFSDLWEIRGARQHLSIPKFRSDKLFMRTRSAAFPMEIPLRLIQMFSVQGDTVLDPFLGTGTTSLAAISAGRSSVGYEVDPRVLANIEEDFVNSKDYLVGLQFQRLQEHLSFVQKRLAEGREIKHRSEHYRFPVMTSQERKLVLPIVTDISVIPERPEGEKQYLFEASHESALDSVLAE
jgi:DNA modification methylase